MQKISYKEVVTGKTAVYLGKKLVGHIYMVAVSKVGDKLSTTVQYGWQYFPVGSKDGGATFRTMTACKQSLVG